MAWWENEPNNKFRQSVAKWQSRLDAAAAAAPPQQAPAYRPPTAQPQQVPSWYTPQGPIAPGGIRLLPYDPSVVQRAQPLTELPAMPPGAPEYAQVPTERQQALTQRDILRQSLAGLPQFGWIFDEEQRAQLPEWLQRPAEFIGEMAIGGTQRTMEGYQKPERRQFMPPVSPQQTFREARQEAQGTIGALGAVAQAMPTPWMQGAGRAVETLAPWLANIPAKFQEETKEWEQITQERTAPRRLEQVAGAGMALLGEPALGLEQLTGGTAIALHPESRGIPVREWAPLTERTWSLVFDQAKAMRYVPGEATKWSEDVLGQALADIGSGRATAEQIATARENFGAELVGQMLADPLNILDAIGFVEAYKYGKSLTRAQRTMAEAAQASPEARRAITQLTGALARTADDEVSALQAAAKAKGIEAEGGFWQKLGNALKSPWELTPASKAERDANELWIVLSGPLSEAPTAEHATQLLADWADNPEQLAQFFGNLPISPAGEKASVILADIIDDIPKLPSADPSQPFNPARFMVEVDDLAMQRLKAAYGYKEPTGLLKFANAWKGLMSEFYLTAIYSPGYVARNVASDLTTMGVDGLATFEHVDDIDAYLDLLGGVTTKRVTTGGKGIMEELTGIAEGESRLPGIFGKISKKGQEITRHGEALGRLPIGEEPRYKRAFYSALKRFFGENAAKQTPDLPTPIRAIYGARADDLIHRVAAELSPDGKRRAVEDFLKGESLGKMIEPTRYVAAVDLDAMSPAIARQVREEIGKLPPTATQEDVSAVFAKVRGTIDEDEARRLADLQEIATQKIASDADEMEIGDSMIQELEDIAARTGDPDLQKRVEEIKHNIPRIEEQLDEARGKVLLGIQEEPSADGLDVLLAANRDAEALRDETRRTLNQLRQETTTAYQADPQLGAQLWPEYFTRTAESWEDLANQRIARYQEASEQLARIRAGEPADQVLGMNRQQLAEMRMHSASKIPEVEGPRGYMPGKVADNRDNAKFESFLNARRAGQDAARSNAWRAAYGADPQDYGKVVDLLDSAERDVELYGKASAGRVAKHRAKALKDSKRAYHKHGGGSMGRLAADRVWEKYYAIRNDEWRRFFEAAEQRWRIAERDVLTNNFRSGPRMEAPAPLSKVEKPKLRPGDDELVRRAALTPEDQWTKDQIAAVKRWTGNGKAMPDVEQLILPAAAEVPPYTRTQFTEDVKRLFNLSDEEADAVVSIADARAKVWAARTGRDPSEWYTARLAGFGTGEQLGAPGTLFQRAPDEGSQAFRVWFGDSQVLEQDTGRPLVMYHGTSRPGFTRFDPTFQDPQSLYGPGFYFTNDPQVAGGWYEMEKVHTFHPTREAAEAVPDRVHWVWKEDYGEHAGEWVAVIEQPKVTRRGYAHKGKALKIEDPQTRRQWVNAVEQSPQYQYLTSPNGRKYLTPSEQERLDGIIPGFLEDGNAAVFYWLSDQPYNLPIDTILERAGLEGPGAVYPVYLSLQNPMDMDKALSRSHAWWYINKAADIDVSDLAVRQNLEEVIAKAWKEIARDLDRGEPVTFSTIFNELSYQLGYSPDAGHALQRWIKTSGFDGITHTGGMITGTEPHRVYIAFEPTQIKSAANVGTFDPTNPDILAQAHKAGKKGATQFLDDGRAIIHALEQPDVSTAIHELAHVFRRELEGWDLRTMELWTGVKDGNWTREAEEKFARAFERYLSKGEAPTPELAGVFERFKQWLAEIYRSIIGSEIDIKVDDGIAGIFDRLLEESPEVRPFDNRWQTYLKTQRTEEQIAADLARKAIYNQNWAPPPLDPEEIKDLGEVAAASMGRGRTPLSVDDAAEIYGTGEDWRALAGYLDRQYKQYGELSDPKMVDGITARWARDDKERFVEVGGYTKTTKRVKSRAAEREYRRSIVGDNPKQFYKRNGELAQWYYDLYSDAMLRAEGQATTIRTPPEWIALEAIEEAERAAAEVPGAAMTTATLQEEPGSWAESVLFQTGKQGKPERIDPGLARRAMAKADKRVNVWTHYIQEHYRATGDLAPGADLADLMTWLEMNMPEELDAITTKPKAPKAQPFRPFPGKRYSTSKGVGEVVSVESGRGAKNAWIRYPDGTTEQVPFDQIQPASEAIRRSAETAPAPEPQQLGLTPQPPPPPTPAPARPAWQELPGAPRQPRQASMFQQGEDLPLFSQTAQRAEAPKFAPPQAAAQPTFPGMEPELGDAAKYAARPAGIPEPEPADLEALRPKKVPKGQAVLWQEASDHPWARQIREAVGAQPNLANGWLLPDGQYAQTFGHDYWAMRIGGPDTTLREFITEAGTPRVNYIGGDPSITFAPKELTTAQRRSVSKLIREGHEIHTWIMIPGSPGAGEYKLITNTTEANALYRRLEELAQEAAKTAEPKRVLWQTDPKQWASYQEQAAQAGATHGPQLADIVQSSTKATHRALDQMEAGILQDWTQWQPAAANQATRQLVTDWLEQQVIPQWHTTRAVGLDYARQTADRALLDYSQRRNFDLWISYIAPYHYWFTRSGWNWAQRLPGRPGLLAGYLRARDAMKQANERAGRRQRFEGKIAIPFPWLPEWAGENLYIDPMKFMIPFANLYGTNWDDADESRKGLQKAFHTLGQVGFRPYHFWELPYQAGWIQKAGEALGMEKEAAAQYLGPETPGNFGMLLPQTRVIQGATALAREAGAEAIPPGGINIEGPLRQLLGLPAGEVWDPYRQSRMLANLAAEDPTNMATARTALMAQELLRRDEDQAGKVWSMESELAQQTAQELGWTPDDLLQAQQMLQKAMQRAAMERGIGTIGWALGPGMSIEPAGERTQLQLAEQARQQTWDPNRPAGSRAAYQQFKQDNPALYPRSTQYTIMPGEEPGTTMPPGYRANWLALTQEKEQINAQFDRQVDDLLRAEPWNWTARGELEDQRRAALDEAKARYPTGEISGDIPAILYGMNPPEMWDSTVEDELYQMQESKPDPGSFEENGSINWGSYYDAIDEWKATLPPAFSFGQPQAGVYQGMDPVTALENYEQRYDSPLEAAYKTYQEAIASPAWDRYNATKDFRGTVGQVGAVKATDLIPEILDQYQAKGWTAKELRQELQGVTFPSLTQQLDLKKGRTTGQAGGQAGTSTGSGKTSTGKTYTGSLAWLSDPDVFSQMEQQVKAEGWRAVYGLPWWEKYKRGGRGGGGGGGSRSKSGSGYASRYGSRYRWRPPETIRGGPWKF